nr:hypothetical protein [Tanacetum cinerariifolium]
MAHLSTCAAAWKIFTWSSRSPVPSYVFILLGIRVFRELSKLRIRGVKGFTSSHVHGFVKSSSVGLCLFDFDSYFSLFELLLDTLDDGDLSLLFVLFWSQREWEEESPYDSFTPRLRSSLEAPMVRAWLLPRRGSLGFIFRGRDLIVLGEETSLSRSKTLCLRLPSRSNTGRLPYLRRSCIFTRSGSVFLALVFELWEFSLVLS